MSLLKPADAGVSHAVQDKNSERSPFLQTSKAALERVIMPPSNAFSFVQEKLPRPVLDEPERERKPTTLGMPAALSLDQIRRQYPAASKPIQEYQANIAEALRVRSINLFHIVSDQLFFEKTPIDPKRFWLGTLDNTASLEIAYDYSKRYFVHLAKQHKSDRTDEVDKVLKPYLQEMELSGLPITSPEKIKSLREALVTLDPEAYRLDVFSKTDGGKIEAITFEQLSNVKDYLYISPQVNQRRELLFTHAVHLGYLGAKGSPRLEMKDVPPSMHGLIAEQLSYYQASPEAEAAAVRKRDEILARGYKLEDVFASIELLPTPPNAKLLLNGGEGKAAFDQQVAKHTSTVQSNALLCSYDESLKLKAKLTKLEQKFCDYVQLSVKCNGTMMPSHQAWRLDDAGNKNHIPAAKNAYAVYEAKRSSELDKLKAALIAAKVPAEHLDSVLRLTSELQPEAFKDEPAYTPRFLRAK